MADTYKAILKFNSTEYSNGWTETVYCLGVNDLKDAAATLYELALTRSKLLGVGVRLESGVVSVDDPLQIADVVNIKPIPAESQDPFCYSKQFATVDADLKPDQFADAPWTVVNCRVKAGAQHTRNYPLSGAPDKLTLGRNRTVIDEDWIALWKKWKTVLISGNFGIKGRETDQTKSPPIKIIGLGDTDPGKVICGAATNYVAGDLVFVHGVKVEKGPHKGKAPHGTYQVKEVASGAFPNNIVTLIGYDGVDAKYLRGGYIRKRIYDVFPIDEVLLGRLTKRSRGRPLGGTRGRAARKA